MGTHTHTYTPLHIPTHTTHTYTHTTYHMHTCILHTLRIHTLTPAMQVYCTHTHIPHTHTTPTHIPHTHTTPTLTQRCTQNTYKPSFSLLSFPQGQLFTQQYDKHRGKHRKSLQSILATAPIAFAFGRRLNAPYSRVRNINLLSIAQLVGVMEMLVICIDVCV